MTGIAYAANGAPPAGPDPIANIVLFGLIILVFYFLLIRPQRQQVKSHQDFLGNLKKGDEVITSGGIHGKITGITDLVVTLEIAENLRIKVNRSSIQSYVADLKKKTEGTQKVASG
ncbi:MAG: preprotein translocase subunit YajC [Desulfobulbaceae bacterium]|nr:preprotein translocase subunit YajC [Desulfobulbaceae bacterium]